MLSKIGRAVPRVRASSRLVFRILYPGSLFRVGLHAMHLLAQAQRIIPLSVLLKIPISRHQHSTYTTINLFSKRLYTVGCRRPHQPCVGRRLALRRPEGQLLYASSGYSDSQLSSFPQEVLRRRTPALALAPASCTILFCCRFDDLSPFTMFLFLFTSHSTSDL